MFSHPSLVMLLSPTPGIRLFHSNLRVRIWHSLTNDWHFLFSTYSSHGKQLQLRRFLRNKSYRWFFFETLPEWPLPSTVSKNTIKMIGHHSRLRDVMGQSYPIYACTRANHIRYLSVHVTFCDGLKHSL